MHDIRAIRLEPDAFDAAMARRGLAPQAMQLIELDEKLRLAISLQQEAETDRNQASKLIGAAKAKGDEAEFQRLRETVSDLKAVIATQQALSADLNTQLQDKLLSLPNIMADDVPDGADESANQEMRNWGEPRSFNY
ncbi:MAG: serine--tRNA ligase, partial [Robiginitomaculum sp.]